MIKKFLALLLVASFSILPSIADPYVQFGGQPQGLSTSITQNVAAVDTAIVMVAPSSHVIVTTSPAAAAVSVNLNNGTATAANYTINPGTTLTYNGRPLVGIHYIGASATGTISVAGW